VGVDGGLYVVIVVVSRFCSHDSEGKRQAKLKITVIPPNKLRDIFSGGIKNSLE